MNTYFEHAGIIHQHHVHPPVQQHKSRKITEAPQSPRLFQFLWKDKQGVGLSKNFQMHCEFQVGMQVISPEVAAT